MARQIVFVGIAILALGVLFHLAIWILRLAIPVGLIILIIGIIWMLITRQIPRT